MFINLLPQINNFEIKIIISRIIKTTKNIIQSGLTEVTKKDLEVTFNASLKNFTSLNDESEESAMFLCDEIGDALEKNDLIRITLLSQSKSAAVALSKGDDEAVPTIWFNLFLMAVQKWDSPINTYYERQNYQ